MRVSGAVLVLSAATAMAQVPQRLNGFELERLELNPGAAGSLLVGTGELLPEGDYRLSTVVHYQRNPLVLALGGQVMPVVGDRATLHLAAAYSPLSWVEMGVQLPVVAFQQGADLTDRGIARPRTAGLATPTVSARLGLLSQRESPWGDLALEMSVGAPLGSTPAFARDVGLRYAPRLMAGRRFGKFRLALDTRLLLRPTIEAYADRELALDEIGNEVHLGFVAATVGWRLRWELDVRGVVPLAQQRKSAEVLVGPRYLMTPSTEVFALAGAGVGSTPGTPLFRVLVGAAFGSVIPPRLEDESGVNCGADLPHTAEECPWMDDDGDEVFNGVDQCPLEKGDPERQGCPIKDADEDGFEDGWDDCPKERGESKWQGCPMPDEDGDKIEDELDRCPGKVGTNERGCPDQDNDEVDDDVDRCPAQAGRKDLQGCLPPDFDQDGISNLVDTCAKVPGTTENWGCPAHEVPLVFLTRKKIELADEVFFVPSQARILERSFPLLNWVAKVIIEHPEVPLVVVEVHTDNRGNPLDNKQRSQERAEAVRQYLIDHKVSPERLEARGYGQDRPIDTNATAVGRENNRRVEFIVVLPHQGRDEASMGGNP